MRFYGSRIVIILALILLTCLQWQGISHSDEITMPSGDLGITIDEAWKLFHNSDIQGAMDLLRDALEENPEHYLIEHTIGVFYMRDRDWDNAVKYFQDTLIHCKDLNVELWTHIYLAEIFKEKGFLEKSIGHLEFVRAHEETSMMIRARAKIEMDLRRLEILDSKTEYGNISVYYPHYMIPSEKIDLMGNQLMRDWKLVTQFLQIDTEEPFSVFVYPTARMMDKFFPPNTTIRETDYLYNQVHTLYHGETDYLTEISPLGFYILARKYNRQGGIPWIVYGIDDAIRGSYSSIPLNSWVSELYKQDKLPQLMFLLEPEYLPEMTSGVKDPTAGSFIMYLKDKVHPNDFYYMLTQPNLEVNLKMTLEEIEVDWIRFCKKERSLLENKDQVAEMVTAVEKFIEPPIVGMDLVAELKKAAQYYNEKNEDKALVLLDAILGEEARYGEALYLKGKIQYDRNKFIEAQESFKEAIKYLKANSSPLGWSYYFLGRIAKLRNEFVEARDYFGMAIYQPLPLETLEECRAIHYRLDKYLSLVPDPAAEISPEDIQGIKAFLQYLDGILAIQDWEQVYSMTAYDLNPQIIDELVNWYRDPEHFEENSYYTHELIKAEINTTSAKLHCIVTVGYVDETPYENEEINLLENAATSEPLTKEYVRYIYLTKSPNGWLIYDYIDEDDLYR